MGDKLAGFTSTYTDATVQMLMAAFAPQQLPQTGGPAGARPLWALLLIGATLLAGGAVARRRLS